METYVREASAHFPVVMVTGARQVGKTTLLKRCAEAGRRFVTLDDTDLLQLAREEPRLFLQKFPPPVMIDEIQYAPGLLPFIKMDVDRTRTSGRYWLTGSQVFPLMKGVSESLAGRVAILRLLGLSRREADGFGTAARPFPSEPASREITDDPGRRVMSPGDLYSHIWRGGFPVPALDRGVNRDLFYSSYVQSYLQRDLRDLKRVSDEMAFLRFLRVCAARTAQLLNLAALARDADISPNTARAWLSILETSGIVYLLEPWHANVTRRLVKAPKLHFLDTGLAAYLAGWSNPETLESGAMSGPILETWVVGELLKSRWHAGIPAPFFHVRDQNAVEIDLVAVIDGRAHPVEIKKTGSPSRNDVRAFATLDHLGLTMEHGAIVCLVPERRPIKPGVDAIPVGDL